MTDSFTRFIIWMIDFALVLMFIVSYKMYLTDPESISVFFVLGLICTLIKMLHLNLINVGWFGIYGEGYYEGIRIGYEP